MKNITDLLRFVLLTTTSLFFVQCHTTKWTDIQSQGDLQIAPNTINKYPNQTLIIRATTPGFNYKFDIGEKDTFYGNTDSVFRFNKVLLST